MACHIVPVKEGGVGENMRRKGGEKGKKIYQFRSSASLLPQGQRTSGLSVITMRAKRSRDSENSINH